MAETETPTIARRILEREHRTLRCDLTPAEVHAAAKKLSAVLRQRAAEVLSFETQREAHKATMKGFEEEISACGIMVDTEEVLRLVECVVEVDWDAKQAVTRRTDTQEVIHTRALTPAESQQEMFHRDGGKKKKAEKSAEKAETATA